MPDSAIGELPLAEYIDDNDKIPMEQGGVAMHITGEQLKAFIDRNILGVRTQTLPEGSDVTGSYNAETGILTLGIPRSLGAANSVDGVSAGTSGDVPLCAVSYDRGQNLTDAQKARARGNLGLSDAAIADLPLSLANGGLGTTSRDDAHHLIMSPVYADGATTSINNIVEPGIYRLYIPENSNDEAYLGWSGYALVEVLGLGGSIYNDFWIQRVMQMASGRCSVRHKASSGNWSYDLPWDHLNCTVKLKPGTTKTFRLNAWKQYKVATFRHTWIVDTSGSSAAPSVIDVNVSGGVAFLTCSAADGCCVTLGNSSSDSYEFFISQS